MRVVQMGLGPIGRGIAARARREPGFELVGAIDPDPDIVGRDLGQLLGAEPLGVKVVADVEHLPETTRADLVLHATGSFLEEVAPQLYSLLDAGLSVVSTCEELSYPYYRHPDLARELDAAAVQAGAVLLGSGINPGFVMDKFAITLLAACEIVHSVRVVRVVDAATRRGPFQKKIGAGMTREAFEEQSAGGRMGHIGLAESAHMLADAMGVSRDRRIERLLRPVLADKPIATDHVSVETGQVAGVHEEIVLFAGDTERVCMELDMYVGAPNPRDAVIVEGTPRLDVEIGSGVAGDGGTVAVVISCAPLMAALTPGLRTMLDVPLMPPTASCGLPRFSSAGE